MAPQPIQITGLRQAKKALRQLPPDIRREFNRAARAAGQEIRDEAKQLVPKRSGRLARSIKVKTKRGNAFVEAGGKPLPYAKPIHFGWPTRPNRAFGWRGGPIRPNPFLYDAADRRRDDVLRRYIEGVEKASRLAQRALDI